MLEEGMKLDVEHSASVGGIALLQRFILKHGRAFEPTRWTGKKGVPKECFSNATHATWNKPRWTYVEGMAVHRDIGIAFQHAWVTDADGKLAYDMTLDKPSKYDYFGIPFTSEFVNQTLKRTKVYGLLGHEMIDLKTMREFDPEFDADLAKWKEEVAEAHKVWRERAEAAGVKLGFNL